MALNKTLEEFLKQPNLGILATLRKDGSPHLTVVWYEYENGEVRISVTDTRVKYKHVLRDPRVSLAVTANEQPYKQVVFEGKAQVTAEGGPELIRRLALRYDGEVEGAKYADYTTNKDTRLVLHFKPERIMSWDFAIEDDDHQAWRYDRRLGLNA
ncbi:MAG: PPOX class F420-dependent oxidoreductase [Chloroflexi bacterium]|nr:PPOX class F420-dependent oxidoreductase [Chloroflexota bacterium]